MADVNRDELRRQWKKHTGAGMPVVLRAAEFIDLLDELERVEKERKEWIAAYSSEKEAHIKTRHARERLADELHAAHAAAERDPLKLDRDRLASENARLRAALEFYADGRNWSGSTKTTHFVGAGMLTEATEAPVRADRGKRARTALRGEKLEEKNG